TGSVPHTDMKDGVGHAIDKDTPFSSGCTSCHGASLQGSIGPSCTTCHGQKWSESAPSGGGSGGTSVPHTDMKDGVGHAIDKDTPFSSGCTSCHGASLQGSIGPSCTTCHGQKWNESAPPTGGTLNGEAQYNSYCAGCHGSSANSSKSGADVSRINSGIANVSSMNSLSSLSSAQIQAIADFLTGGTTPPPTGATDGATLYANSCSSCHGAGSSSTKAGASVTRIIGGITGLNSVSSMNYLEGLTVAEVQAISDYLVAMGSSTPPPATSTGSALYANNCAACHGADSSSSKIGATVVRINTGISSVSSMNSLSSLSAAEILAISDYLVSLDVAPPPASSSSGATLYTNNCAACHGPGDSSAKAGATVSRINTGIAAVSGMNYLSNTLSSADIQAIAEYLAAIPTPTTPSGLYQAYCASCHGATGSGGSSGEDVRGDSASDIASAIDSESEMRSLDFLSYSQLEAIAQFLKTSSWGD
ncbi:MAG: c-type cytochrome, partial [Gammaproteobacteria bacterium]|nr:c-type cytochrome [Gammaproteobacteria bacterium]